MKHTPGPWIWLEKSEWMDMPSLASPSGEVCNFGDSQTYYPTQGEPPNKADARLIATAPELLEALQALDDYMCDNLTTDYPTGVDIDHAVFKAARSAIAKATGEQP